MVSHCPGLRLEDWITDWHRIVDVDGKFGTLIRRMYAGELILTADQFSRLVDIYEPIREHVENLLFDYSEEECGSWRDYCGNFMIPQDIEVAADTYIKLLGTSVPKTLGWQAGRTNESPK